MLNAHFTRSACIGLVVLVFVTQCTNASASLLWQIEKNGKRNYILGTIHVPDRNILDLLNRIDNVMERTHELVLEVRQDADTRQIVARRMHFLHGNLRQVIGPELFNRLSDVFQSREVEPSKLLQLKPWAVGLMLNLPSSNMEPVLDEKLQYRYQREGKPVASLETVTEQMNIFDHLSEQEQIQFLRLSLSQVKEYKANLAQMKALYLKGDINSISRLAQAQRERMDSPAMDKLMHNLLEVRNQRMFERMQPFLAKSGVLFAVGALHLPGKQGLLHKIRSAGFTLSPVYP